MLNGAAGMVPETKVTLLEDTSLQKVFEVLIDRGNVLENVESTISLEAENVHIAGFRPGKAPKTLRMNSVRKKRGEEIFGQEMRHAIGKVIDKIISDGDLLLSGQPSVDFTGVKDEKWFVCKISIGVLPQAPGVDLSDSKFRVTMLELEMTESDVKDAYDQALKVLERHVSAKEGHKAALGDALIIDFVGTVDGNEFQDNQLEGVKVVIGSGEFVKDFEDQMISLQKGDKKSINVSFPNDYYNTEIAGKVVTFDVTVIDVLTAQHNSINEESVKEFGVQSVSEFDKMVREKIKRDFGVLARLYAKKKLFDLFDEHVNFDVPETIVQMDLAGVKNESRMRNQYNRERNLPEDLLTSEQEYAIAKKRSKLGLILTGIARSNNIKVTKEDLENSKAADIERNPNNKERVEEMYSNDDNVNKIMGAILEEKIVDFLFSKVLIEKKIVTSKEFAEKYAKEIEAR